jgi:hypothetical protein
MNFARDNSLGLDFDAASCKDDAIETSRNHNAIPFNLSFDFCILSKDHRLFGDDVPFNVSVDAKRSCERERAFKRNALIDKPGPFFTANIM